MRYIPPANFVPGSQYTITLTNLVKDTSANNITYKIHFDFGNINPKLFSIAMVEQGNFTGAYSMDDNTVVFTMNELKPLQTVVGIVTFHLDDRLKERHVKAEMIFDLSANGVNSREPQTVDPGGFGAWIEVAGEIVNLATDLLDFGVKLHNETYTCVNILRVNYDTNDGSNLHWKPVVQDCAQHDETIAFRSASDFSGFPSNSNNISPDRVHLNQKQDTDMIGQNIDVRVPDGNYDFTLHADVIMKDLFGNERPVDSVGYIVTVPEFPFVIFALSVALAFVIIARQKGLIRDFRI